MKSKARGQTTNAVVAEWQTACEIFFSSVAADLALRLGPREKRPLPLARIRKLRPCHPSRPVPCIAPAVDRYCQCNASSMAVHHGSGSVPRYCNGAHSCPICFAHFADLPRPSCGGFRCTQEQPTLPQLSAFLPTSWICWKGK